ncbi:hypothetical protein ACFL2Q_07220 [Thermodesulfobacteriota bacterium]
MRRQLAWTRPLPTFGRPWRWTVVRCLPTITWGGLLEKRLDFQGALDCYRAALKAKAREIPARTYDKADLDSAEPN